MNVLAISCHPDDMEINCSGTLLKCKKRGDNVTVCHVANGNMGHVEIPPEELGPMRIKEAQNSGELAGFKIVTLDVGDLLVDETSKEQHDKLVKVIRDAKPDFIITHAPDDYMRDHVATSKLTFAASFAASVPHYEPQLGEATPLTPIFYMENAANVDCEPEYYVDITDELETKLQMLACHKSQLVWLMDHDNVDILQNTCTYAAFRGMQCGVKYAEGFRRLKADLRNPTTRLLP